jgi:hypothetical protein
VANLPVDPITRTIKLRGIAFPVDCIRQAMLETGGSVVSDEEINRALDIAMYEVITSGKKPEALYIESIPAVAFIPKRVKVHLGLTDSSGQDSGMHLYFAVPKRFHA